MYSHPKVIKTSVDSPSTVMKDRYSWISATLILVTVFLVMLPLCPTFQPTPGRDSGVFMYVGKQLLIGEVPYRDIWDHKGPLVYFINAIGFLSKNNNRWGIWIIEVISLSLASTLGYLFMAGNFNRRISLLSILIFLTSCYPLLEGGNLTEEYNLPVQFGSLFLLGNRKTRSGFTFLIFGILIGLSAMLRPNNMVIPLLAILFNLKIKKPKYLMSSLMYCVVGLGMVFGFIAMYLFWNQAIGEFVDQVFIYNFIYSQTTASNRILGMIYGFLNYPILVSFSLLISWFYTIEELLKSIIHKEWMSSSNTRLYLFFLIGLPCELFLSGFSGRTYIHYYLTWLPFCVIAVGIIADFLWKAIRYFGNYILLSAFTKNLLSNFRWLLLLLLLLNSILSYSTALSSSPEPKIDISNLDFLHKKADYLLVWGAETRINLILDFPSPGRYSYIYPLITKSYTDTGKIDEYLDAIISKKPIIVDASAGNPIIPPLISSQRLIWEETRISTNTNIYYYPLALREIYSIIDKCYKQQGSFSEPAWIIYSPSPECLDEYARGDYSP